MFGSPLYYLTSNVLTVGCTLNIKFHEEFQYRTMVQTMVELCDIRDGMT